LVSAFSFAVGSALACLLAVSLAVASGNPYRALDVHGIDFATAETRPAPAE